MTRSTITATLFLGLAAGAHAQELGMPEGPLAPPDAAEDRGPGADVPPRPDPSDPAIGEPLAEDDPLYPETEARPDIDATPGGAPRPGATSADISDGGLLQD